MLDSMKFRLHEGDYEHGLDCKMQNWAFVKDKNSVSKLIVLTVLKKNNSMLEAGVTARWVYKPSGKF